MLQLRRKDFDIDNTTTIFAIKPDIQNDVYYLYYKNRINELEKYDMAAVPDFKTSKMMNTIFRNIKENDNLDALEESDDEDEFENIDLDKFVSNNSSNVHSFKIACVNLTSHIIIFLVPYTCSDIFKI